MQGAIPILYTSHNEVFLPLSSLGPGLSSVDSATSMVSIHFMGTRIER